MTFKFLLAHQLLKSHALLRESGDVCGHYIFCFSTPTWGFHILFTTMKYTENIFLLWSWTLSVSNRLSFDDIFRISRHVSSEELNHHSIVNSARRALIMGGNEHFSPQQQLQWLFVMWVLQVVCWLRRRFSIQRLSSVPSSSVCWIWSSSYLNELKIIGGQVELGRGEEEEEGEKERESGGKHWVDDTESNVALTVMSEETDECEGRRRKTNTTESRGVKTPLFK